MNPNCKQNVESPLELKMLLNLTEIFENLILTCGHAIGLDTPSSRCHTLSHIPLPPPSPTVRTSFMDAPQVKLGVFLLMKLNGDSHRHRGW